jgi:hypothetical protein
MRLHHWHLILLTPMSPHPDVNTFVASTITHLHAKSTDVQDIGSLVPAIPNVSIAHYTR